jgi:lipopolysaccharide export system protein LptA
VVHYTIFVPISIPRLRRWFAAAVLFVCVLVLGNYLYLRHRVRNALKEVPEKIGINIQQSAQGFTVSKSEQGRTLFKLQASKAIQFKLGGKAALREVTITLYGRDSSRFDQVYGQEFEYDQPSGDVTSKGEVSIDLQANPRGILAPDQAAPRELKNPIHLKTKDLIFNVKTGDAFTASTIDFQMPQATGSALGARYIAKDAELTFESDIKVATTGPASSTIVANHAVIEKNSRQIVLRGVRGESPAEQAHADEVVAYLRADNTLERAVASGNVFLHKDGPRPVSISAQNLETLMNSRGEVKSATFTGSVHLTREGQDAEELSAGKAELTFGSRNSLTKVHASEQVKMLQRHTVPGAQDVEIAAPGMDFFLASGDRLTRADTVGPPQISLLASDGKQGATHITAEHFTAQFDSQGRISSVHGAHAARIVSLQPGNTQQPERVTSSDSLDAQFVPGAGVRTVVQQGNFTYAAGSQRAFADRARYTPDDHLITLSGSPRITDTGIMTTALMVRINRETGEAFAQGEVKTTYSDLKPQPSGALLASSDPVHVTAQNMTARNNPASATYTGGARLWQNANVIQAPSIQFQKDGRTVLADSTSDQRVSTVLVGTGQSGKTTAVNISANHLVYRDSDRKAHFEGGVTIRGADLTITSRQMDVFLASVEKRTGPARLERIIAAQGVVITEGNRRATGEQLTYTASDDKFVLIGGPPSIFDAEHGKITGVSLTFFRADDRVVVEGDSRSPAVTQTRVVR